MRCTICNSLTDRIVTKQEQDKTVLDTVCYRCISLVREENDDYSVDSIPQRSIGVNSYE